MKILKYIIFTALFLFFLSSTFGINFLTQYSTTLAHIKTNFVDKLPTETYFLINGIVFTLIIYLFRKV